MVVGLRIYRFAIRSLVSFDLYMALLGRFVCIKVGLCGRLKGFGYTRVWGF